MKTWIVEHRSAILATVVLMQNVQGPFKGVAEILQIFIRGLAN